MSAMACAGTSLARWPPNRSVEGDHEVADAALFRDVGKILGHLAFPVFF
jgi:hypothetical protein